MSSKAFKSYLSLEISLNRGLESKTKVNQGTSGVIKDGLMKVGRSLMLLYKMSRSRRVEEDLKEHEDGLSASAVDVAH